MRGGVAVRCRVERGVIGDAARLLGRRAGGGGREGLCEVGLEW